MSLINQIRLPIEVELKVFKKRFENALITNNPLLSNINDYVLQGSGKQLRPIITILSAKICGEVSDATYNGALAIELLHNASLIHDDVVDDTLERRGRASVKAKWTNKIAVLSGDYVFSKSLECGADSGILGILKSISVMGVNLADGELLQLQNTSLTYSSEIKYFEIIRKKTALLFATCAEVGALSVFADSDSINHLKVFGEYLGVCFQIKDDIFDYFEDIKIGKPTGNDIRDGKITLPLIHALQNTTETERNNILEIIDNKEFSVENIKYITHFVQQNGGIEYAVSQMEKFKIKAIVELKTFADSEFKDALMKCAEFATSRNI